jgi:dinuclear metal center YbgI/SA1388 family protein
MDMIRLMAQLAPPHLAEQWDNVGLQLGDPNWPAQHVWVALDPLPEVVNQACDNNVNLLITHHPLFFKPIKAIDCSSFEGALILRCLTRRLSIFSAHTNLDSAQGGINELLCRLIGLTNLRVLKPVENSSDSPLSEGLGRIGDLPEPLDFDALIRLLKKTFTLSSLRYSGKTEGKTSRIAVCSGSGSALLPEFFESDAQVYISGDLKYHDARSAEIRGRLIIDIGHFPSEHVMVDALASRLEVLAQQNGLAVHVEACRLETDPFKTIQ